MADVLSIDTLYEGWSSFSLVRLRLEDGSVVERALEDHGQAVAVLPYDPERRLALLVRQLRVPILLLGEEGYPEQPAGMLEHGEDPADCARREVEEETGVRLRELEPLGRYWSSPGCSTERVHLFLAPYAASDRIGAGGGVDEHEDIKVVEAPLAELAARLDAGELRDIKLLALVLALKARRPELFGEDLGRR